MDVDVSFINNHVVGRAWQGKRIQTSRNDVEQVKWKSQSQTNTHCDTFNRNKIDNCSNKSKQISKHVEHKLKQKTSSTVENNSINQNYKTTRKKKENQEKQTHQIEAKQKSTTRKSKLKHKSNNKQTQSNNNKNS